MILRTDNTQMIQRVHGEVHNPPVGAPSQGVTGTYLDNNVTNIKTSDRAPFRCTSILGICGVTMTNARCLQLCINYYGEIHPNPRCDKYPPGSKVVLCYCEHDCIKKN